jgi:hypothetical protein
MPLLRPLRDYNEKDVINLYTFSGQANVTTIVNKGTLVKIVGDGWRSDTEPTEMLGSYGDFSINNVQAQRYGTPAKVTYCGATASDYPIGFTLFDVRELDENAIPLKYNPRKAAELEVCISGQTVPIVTKGTFLYSGLTGAFSAGAPIYAAANGTITAFPAFLTGVNANPVVGKTLGVSGADSFTLIRLSL